MAHLPSDAQLKSKTTSNNTAELY
ncbi:hypothetical protein TGARI_311230A, partial [Toxoplasma gondii ARI]